MTDSVGTRCSASGSGFRLWTRNNVRLPLNSFTPSGGYPPVLLPLLFGSNLNALHGVREVTLYVAIMKSQYRQAEPLQILLGSRAVLQPRYYPA